MDLSLTAEQQRQATWASEVREKIEAGWQQSERGERVDRGEVFRRLKKRLEDRADPRHPKQSQFTAG
ncbi:MAG: hypothetical protein IPJ19_04305 [Planctomycetes bacterium]|nr:hypothetical protein [Planctomycetota bacterium]